MHSSARSQSRHNRWGLTSDSRLATPGDLSHQPDRSRTTTTGCGRRCMSRRSASATRSQGSGRARQRAPGDAMRLMRLESITGIPGFPGALVHQGRGGALPTDGEWHEHAGQGVAMERQHELRRDRWPLLRLPGLLRPCRGRCSRKPALRGGVDRITNHILDHDYRLIGPDGQPTRMGMVGARRGLGRCRRNRAARAAHPVASARRPAPDCKRSESIEVPGRVTTT